MNVLQRIVATPLAEALGWTLLHSLWQGAGIAAILGAVLMSTQSARLRYAAACLAMFGIVMCAGFTLIHVMPNNGNVRTTIDAAAAVKQVGASGNFNHAHPGIGAAVPWLAPFWMAGVWILALRQMMGWMSALRLRRRGVCSVPSFWDQQIASFAARLTVNRPVRLLESCMAEVPVVVGHFRPIILMPIGALTGFPAAQVESILLHELAHVRRCDYLVNFLQRAVECLLFYHPIVWWISRVVRNERENCCDDVVASMCDVHEYAVALTALEQNRWSEQLVAASGGNLMNRIRRLLKPKAVGAWSPVLASMVVIGTAVAAFAAWPAHNNQVGAPLPSGQDAEQRAQLQDVRFIGVTQLDADAVNNCAENLKASTYAGPKWQEAAADRARIVWQDHGYYKVQLTPEFQRLPDRNGLPQYALTLVVNEGAQYRLADISFRNNRAFSSSELRQMFSIADGDLFSRDAVVQGLSAVHRAYMGRGYPNWVGVPAMQVDEVNHTVAMVLNVQEAATNSVSMTPEAALAQSTSDAGPSSAHTSQQENYTVENKRVREIKYVGIESFSQIEFLDRVKQDKVTLAQGLQYDPTETKQVEVVIKQLEAEHGHRFATVRTKVQNIPPGDVGITFVVSEGPKGR